MSVDEMAIGQPDSTVSMHKFAVNSSMHEIEYSLTLDDGDPSLLLDSAIEIANYSFELTLSPWGKAAIATNLNESILILSGCCTLSGYANEIGTISIQLDVDLMRVPASDGGSKYPPQLLI